MHSAGRQSADEVRPGAKKNSGSESVFEHMARLVLVRDLQSALGPDLQVSLTAGEAFDALYDFCSDLGYDPIKRVSLVMEEEGIVGWTLLELLDAGKTLSECMVPVVPGAILSAETSALEAVEVFARKERPFYFVFDHSRITGTLYPTDLFELPFRLCLFALALHLEDAALRLLLRSPQASWDALSEERRAQAATTYEKRLGHAPDAKKPPLDRLLRCTMFCDKGKVLAKRRLLTNPSSKSIKSVFSRAEKVRNDCAHTNPDLNWQSDMMRPRELHAFIGSVQSLIDAIELQLSQQERDCHNCS